MHRLVAPLVPLLVLSLAVAYAEIPEPPGRVTGEYDVPVLAGEPWPLAGNPDLGKYSTPKQQPVDFAVWQAADGTWQLWSCIRGTSFGGKNRLLHRWEGKGIEVPDWKPMGVAMTADESLGETSVQAPHVVKHDGQYHMLYGDWNNVCRAVSDDGKIFTRVIQPNGKTGMYSDGEHTRDPMAIKIDDLWYVYTTCNPFDQGVIRCRTSPDLKTWSKYTTTVGAGGRSTAGKYAAECPHVVKHKGLYYLFRTQVYGKNAKTHVYVSSDPLNFGNNRDEWYYVKTFNIAAPEYVEHDGKEYLVYLNPKLNGIRAQRLEWRAAEEVKK